MGYSNRMNPIGPHQQDPHERMLQEVDARQRNILWPDAMINSSSVDALLWKGSPKATKVQRVGIAIWGFVFLSAGASFMLFAFERHQAFFAGFSVFSLAVGTKITLNAFMRQRKPRSRKRR